jgi:hypothetical protein
MGGSGENFLAQLKLTIVMPGGPGCIDAFEASCASAIVMPVMHNITHRNNFMVCSLLTS